MNIEIANKLLKLRKDKGYSQEQLAAELGISRQAISKWERAEASPDTDNLIELARLYGVSLDDLLLHEPEKSKTKEEYDNGFYNEENTENEKYTHVGFDGIHVKDSDDEVHISWEGIHVKDKNGETVDIGKQGVHVNGKHYDKNEWKDWSHEHHYFPIGMIVGVGTFIYCIITGNWHPTWIVLLSIPLIGSLFSAIKDRKLSNFAYPILTTMIFLWYGFTESLWHPTWVVFLTIPCYYAIAHYIEHRKDF